MTSSNTLEQIFANEATSISLFASIHCLEKQSISMYKKPYVCKNKKDNVQAFLVGHL